jgi:hypothetical protein
MDTWLVTVLIVVIVEEVEAVARVIDVDKKVIWLVIAMLILETEVGIEAMKEEDVDINSYMHPNLNIYALTVITVCKSQFVIRCHA